MWRCNRFRSSWSPRRLRIPGTDGLVAGVQRLFLWSKDFIVWGTLIAGSAMIFSMSLLEPRAQPLEAPPAIVQIEPIDGVAFSPDGKTLASCGWDHGVRIWDLSRVSEGPECEPEVLPHGSAAYAVSFSADGKRLAAVGSKSLTIWSCNSGVYTPVFDEEIETSSHCLAFSADGRTLAIGSDDGAIHLWDMPGNHERAILRGHVGAVRSVGFSPDSRRLVSTDESRSIMLWDAVEGNEIRPLQLGREGSNFVLFAAFATDGRHVAVGESGGTPECITLLDSETGEVRNTLAGHSTGILALTFSPDGRTLATASVDRTIKLWDWSLGKELTTLVDGVGCVRSLAFSKDGARLAFAGDDDSLRIWEVARCRLLQVGRFARPGSDGTRNPILNPSARLSMAIFNWGITG